ncbi:MAG: hypothetical protein FJ291_21030 [Planctomycetes bacterium]|nr:hypothetical protein [Planctomycetota bacterium]
MRPMFRKLLWFFGVTRADGEKGRIRLRRRFYVWLAVLLFFGGGGTFFYFSSKSWFCATCHVMRPYVRSWRESVHGQKGVECIECHFPPGFRSGVAAKFHALAQFAAYITGTYSTKFRAEIDDASCLRSGCHDTRLLEGKATFKGVHFDSVQGDGRVPKQVCLGCHTEPDRLAKYDDHEFMHKNHVTDHNVECFHCHSEIRHGRNPEPEPSDPTCNRCHTGKHDYTAQLYRGTGARGVKDKPSAMWAAKVQCIACHQFPGGIPGHAPRATYEAGEKACVECHGKDVEGMLASWREDVAKALKKAADDLAKATATVQARPSPQAEQLLADARHNLELVQYGRGVHNLDYAVAVLRAVSANAAKACDANGEGK